MMNKESSEKATSIKVFVRVRPLVGAELGSNEVVDVEGDVRMLPLRARPSRYPPTPSRSSRPSSTLPSPRSRLSLTSSTISETTCPRCPRATTSQSSHTDKRAPGKHTPCLGVTGSRPYPRTSSRSRGRTPFLRI